MDSYAAQARLHMAQFGTTQRQLAAIAAKNHRHSEHNPLSQYNNVMSIEDVLAARSVSWPLTVPMCAPISDGSAAAIVCSRDELDRFPKAAPVRVLASVMQGGRNREALDFQKHAAKLAAHRAYEMAGIGPQSLTEKAVSILAGFQLPENESLFVMAGLVSAIHVFLASIGNKGVDARHKAGHDEAH